MSEDLDLEANNLCIPEDAFEKFQAVSMYQEEEYITLPQKVPLKPKPPAPDESCPVSNVNEVVSSSGNVTISRVNSTEIETLEEKQLNSSCVESSIGLEETSNVIGTDGNKQLNRKNINNYENYTDMVVSNSENVNDQPITTAVSPTPITSVVPRKRGRKPKKPLVPMEELSIETPKNIQNPDISSTPFSSDPETSDMVPVGRTKRGRPRKALPNDTSNMVAINSDKDLSSELSNSDNNKTVELSDSVKKPSKGKRGRPKGSGRKIPAHVNLELQTQPPILENKINYALKEAEAIHNQQLNSSSNETSKIHKRRIESLSENIEKTVSDEYIAQPDSNNKLLSDSFTDEDQDDDVCLSKLKSTPCQSNMSVSADENCPTDNKPDDSLKNINSENIDGQLNKAKKRRGRPKKEKTLESLSQMIENSLTVTHSIPINDITLVEDSDADDMCLSKLKEINEEPPKNEEGNDKTEIPATPNKISEQAAESSTSETNGTPTKRNTKMPVMADFEYNIDSVIGNDNTDVNSQDVDNSLLVEDTSKRPIRRKIKTLKYDEESDEDPFANVELSDDEPRRGRRGNKYYSDDEYIPGKRGNDAIDSTDTEVSDGKEMKSDDTKRHKRKKFRKRSDNQSPRKKGKKDEETNPPDESIHKTDQTDDIEICLEPSVIRASDGDSQQSLSSQKWGTTTEFENFLAKKIQGTNLKIKKVSSNLPVETTKMEIPVIDPEAKKTIEMCSQTTAVPTASVSVQTSTPNDLPLKENIPLTTEQSEKACYFLNSIVKTTAELGSLMTQKSEDFIKKKINTSHVTDTAKMDYCVKKSFLLFKLAKHNLLQMEEDLATQYDEFLKTHNLTRCREEPKAVLPTPKESNSDSDCEIVDVKPSPNIKPAQKPQAKPAFNPKTVFLNKELSIKIAKKPSENKKLDIKGRHTVWINDTVMVKKVKPTQSFLAQDSRNKKPPDNCITTEMVSDFFKDYYRQKALSACAPFVSTNWLNMSKDCVCNYFVVKPLQFQTDTNYSDNNGFSISSHASNTTVSAPGHSLNDVMTLAKNTVVSSPEPLFTLCFRIIKRHLHHDDFKESTHKKRHEIADWKSIPVTLFRLCMRTIIDCTTSKMEICPSPVKHASSSSDIQVTPAPLKSLCHRRIVDLLEDSTYNNTRGEKESYIDKNCYSEESSDSQLSNSQEIVLATENNKNSMKSLFSLCVEYIQQTQQIVERNNNSILSPKTLKTIAYENVKYLLYANDLYESHQDDGETAIEGLMINCVNTLSEEAFLNLEQCNTEMPDSSEYIDDFDNEDNFEQDATCTEEEQTEPSWVTQVQMQELRSCVNINSLDANGQHELEPIITQIKLEPLDDITDNFIDSTQVKIEPGPGPDEMTIIPDVKPEIEEHLHAAPIQRQSSNSYDGEAFETFVNCNKLMRALTDQDTEEIYSQSSERIRRQHEPDYYEENAADMLGLLVPHTYQTMNIQTAKGILMESSSDESNKKVSNTAKKATAKRSRGRPRKAEQKPNNKEIPVPAHPVLTKEKEKTTSNEVAILTRKMKERIRQEEKKNESSDSESENITVRLRSREKKDTIDFAKDKSKLASKETLDQVKSKPSSKETLDQVKSKPSSKETLDQAKDKLKPGAKETNANTPEKSKPVPKETPYLTRDKSKIAIKETIEQIPEKSKPTSSSKAKNIEIQCNNVDSTDQLEDSVESFTGFTSIETNEMSNYEKYMKFVYEKVIPDKEEDYANFKKEVKGKVTDKDNKTKVDKSNKPLICPNEPVELLECEPTMPIFDDKINNEAPPKKNEIKATISEEVPPFIDRHGWECYPIDVTDFKLCQNACIYLEKLPESFVQTYFQYQNIAASIDKSDEEINRLTNLNTLNRTTILKDRKPQNCCKRDPKDDKPGSNLEDDSRTVSAVESDHYQELLPSDDDTPNVEDEVAQPMQRQTDNTLAKNCLMDDKESDDEALVKVKSEPVEGSCDTKKIKPSPKKKVVDPEDSGDLMLTADKMMNKELTLLHAPVVMDEQVKETPTKGPVTRHNKKSGTKTSPTNNKVKTEEDSSSEEEKQWVSTKEKLLKRMGKKESASADDAKRAKLVSEFIERREGNPDGRKRRSGARPRRSGKRFLEREKQLRVLQRELFGEMSNDPTVTKRSVAAWKGRRNIRKVLDKKSLARSTVIANMEEFERKRRLNARQTKLRELLGCEEGVNVLVINDEVCLEYDFEEHRPVVTIHPFFTKVMKAHQYEGVKFMWDACFESLADLEARRAGGGCILAHCMGLGKTLQVLALLHTVLTHPRVGMHRVLVCCPLSTVLNWVDEIHKWIGPVTNQIKVFELSKLKKTYERAYQLEDWYNGGGIFIIGYELFRSLSTLDPLLDDVRPTIVNKIRTALLDPGPDIIVCDEGHLLKNDCSVLAVAMSRVVTKRRIILTGTPMQNNLREYYCMVNFVKPNLLGTYSEYSNRFENPIMNGQHRDSSEEDIKLMKARTHILHKVLEGCLQRQEVSVLYPYLPKKHEYTVFITLTKCQWDLYKHYLNHYSKQMKQNSILKDFHILQKIWSHPQVLHNFQTKSQETRNKIKLEKLEDDLATEEQEDIKDVATELWWLPYLDDGNMLDSLESSNKFVVVFRILDECVALGDKVLIFSTSLFCLDALEYFLKKINKWSLGQEYYRLDGSVPAEVRQKWCREFNAENNLNTKLFLVSTRAGCLGLNMTGANRVIIMDTSWNPAHDIQSIFRVYRFGQKKDCYIYRLVAMGTMEQKIYERSVTKQAVACRVVDEQQIDRHYNMAELTELYRYDEAGASVAGGVAVGVCDVALLRVARETALHAVHEHDSLLRSSEQGLPEHERAAAWMQFQQEQAHKQMENKLIANIPKLSLKRVQGNAYTKSLHLEDIKTEIKIEDASNDFLPLQEAKAKKGKKPSRKIVIEIPPKAGSSKDQTAEHYNPEAPGTSKEPKESLNDKQYEDEIMVHKITELLIKHDFQNRKANTEIANLVTNVRRIVKQGYIYKHDKPDDLTTSIAKVLLQKRMSLPVLTDIMCESINKTVSPDNSQEPENILSTPNPTNESTVRQNAPDNRRKRKAALAAEKHIDSISQDVIISLDEDMDPSDTDFVPKIVEKSEKTNSKRKSILRETLCQKTDKDTVKTLQRTTTTDNNIDKPNNSPVQDIIVSGVKESVSKSDSVPKSKPANAKPKAGPKTFKEKLKKKKIIVNIETPAAEGSSSILLSDDEDEDKTSSAGGTTAAPAADDDEVVPLPLSLLTNKNFINIVAHTYLNGNPMLDADAATLAAQYSTFKSLKEAEQTGKDIVSGPIYDIALKVIGKTLFKRMNSNNIKSSNTTAETANVSIELKERMDKATDKKCKEEAKPKKKKQEKVDTPGKRDCNMIESSTNACPNGNVVPVGLIKTAGSLPSQDFAESILPDDDDDMHIVPHDYPPSRRGITPAIPARPSQPSPTPQHSTMQVTQTKESLPKQNKGVDSKPSTSTATKPPTKKVNKAIRGKIIHPTSVVSGNSSQAKQPPTQHILSANDTICLDSDEEETITPTPLPTVTPARQSSPAPVPVSLTLGPPLEDVSPGPATTKPMTSAQGLPAKSLVLRQVVAGSGSKFVLVPALPSTVQKPPKLIPKEPVKTQSTPLKAVPAESILSTTNSSSLCLKKIKQARCKPGDIIKISDNGEIEVLQVAHLKPTAKQAVSEVAIPKLSNEIPKSKPPSEVTNSKPIFEVEKPKSGNSEVTKSKSFIDLSKPIPSISDVTKPKPVVNKPAVNKPAVYKPAVSKPAVNKPGVSQPSVNKPAGEPSVTKPAENRTPKPRTVSISSSSSEGSRPGSPDNNPLSILKNVVQIQAADETTGKSSDNAKSKQKASNCSYTEHVNLTESKDSSKGVAAKKLTKESLLKTTKEVVKTIKEQPKSKDVGITSSISSTSMKTDTSNKLLTDLLNKKTTLSMKPTLLEKKPVLPGGLKAIVIDKNTVSSSNKTFKTVDLTQTMSVKSGCGASMLKTKIEAKKRVSSTETSTPKKKKTEPMTLKDFNLDDIDDIIELD